MLVKRLQQLIKWLVCASLVVSSSLQAQERFEVLHVGVLTYSNVLVVNKTPVDLFITHAQGLSNIKVVDLDPELASELGYSGDGTAPRRAFTVPKLPVNVTPEDVEDLQAQINEDVLNNLSTVPKGTILGGVGGLIAFYLFFCFCCKLICDKAGSPSKLLVWLPGFQLFPLLRAAKMSPWWVVGFLFPGILAAAIAVFVKPDADLTNPRTFAMLAMVGGSFVVPFILHIIWCVKIVRARDKSGLVAFALWFPPTSTMAFLYLAFSPAAEIVSATPPARPNYVTFS